MPYIDPSTVISPKDRVSDVHVVFDAGPVDQSWSVATLKWENNEAVGLRWNGEVGMSGVGMPSSRANPTWFIVPDDIAPIILDAAKRLAEGEHKALLDGYKAMAADKDREAEAEEWSEAMIGDSYEAR